MPLHGAVIMGGIVGEKRVGKWGDVTCASFTSCGVAQAGDVICIKRPTQKSCLPDLLDNVVLVLS